MKCIVHSSNLYIFRTIVTVDSFLFLSVKYYENHWCSLFALLEPRSKCLKKETLFLQLKCGFYA